MQTQSRNAQSTAKPKHQRFPWMVGVLVSSVLIVILAFIAVTLLILSSQGVTQGITTLTILSILAGFVVSVLSLLVSFLQWHHPKEPSLSKQIMAASQNHSPPVSTSEHLQAVVSSNDSPQDLQDLHAPPPRSIPQQFWSVPLRRNPLFTGREELLQHIHERFAASNSDKTVALNQSQAINGLGGIGKTQTALEYVYRYRQEYRAVLWVSAASEEALQEDMIALARVLELEVSDREPPQLIAAVKAWLTQQHDWLLILDNADDLVMVHSYLPDDETSRGHTLLTTRAQAGGPLIRMVPVEYMSQEEGTLLLLRRAKVLAPQETLAQASAKCRAEAEAIVAELGGLPLAIDQAGAYLEETGSILSSYLELYHLRRKELLQRRSTLPSDHPKPVATTWSLSFRRVEEANVAAADLLRLCAFLDPDVIPETMFIEGGALLGPVLKPVMADPFALNQAIEELRKFSLVRRNANAGLLSLHRLVQVVLKDDMPKKTQLQWAKRAVLLVHAVFPRGKFAGWERREYCRLYLPHVLACATLIEIYHFTFEEAVDLLYNAGKWYLRQQGLYAQSESLLQQALAIGERLGDAGQDLLANILDGLVILYRDWHKYEHALPYGQRALAIKEQIFGPDHPETAAALDHLAQYYVQLRKYEQAESLLQRALSIEEQQIDPDHLVTAYTLHDLALLYRLQGKYEQALPYGQRALAIKEQISGPDNPETGTTLFELAILYHRQGKYEQAEPLYQRALAIDEQQLDPNHPWIAGALRNLASLCQDQGKYEQAESLYQRALAIYECTFDSEHAAVVTVLENYAALLRDMHRDEEAARLIKRVQDIQAKGCS